MKSTSFDSVLFFVHLWGACGTNNKHRPSYFQNLDTESDKWVSWLMCSWPSISG